MIAASARLLQLLSLFQSRRSWSGAALCGRLEVTARTLRRDVGRLRCLGYPVQSAPGAGGGYQLGDGSAVPPLVLDDDEAVAVAVSLRTAANGTVEGIEEPSLRALSKLEQVLPQRLRPRVAALHSYILPLAASGHAGVAAVDAATLSAIAAACRDCVCLRFPYRGKDGAAGERHVEPHRLVHTGRRWYLAAWDTEREDWRTFRLDRIELLPGARLRTGPRFTPREAPGGDFAAWVARSVFYAPSPWQARILLYADAESAAARLPPCAGSIEAVDERTSILHIRGSSLDALSIWIALMGFDFEICEPPELAERVCQLAGRFSRAAGKGEPARLASTS